MMSLAAFGGRGNEGTMKNPQLIARVRAHYESRSFSPRLVDGLCLEIERRTAPAGIEIAKGWHIAAESISELLGPIEQTPRPAILHPAPAAILSFSFGYRLDSPFARHPEDRRPGPNNIALAEMTRQSHALFPKAWIGVQHEVAIALDQHQDLQTELATPPRDWNTNQVLDYFVSHLPRYAFAGNRCVIVVAHLHHYGRIEMLLARAGLEAFPAPKEVAAYADYDPQEAQPRFRSPWEYLVNDFLALSKVAGSRNRFVVGQSAAESDPYRGFQTAPSASPSAEKVASSTGN